jgi:hypothetical protein
MLEYLHDQQQLVCIIRDLILHPLIAAKNLSLFPMNVDDQVGRLCFRLLAYPRSLDLSFSYLEQDCHNGRFWMKLTVRMSFLSGRPPTSAFTPWMGFYRPRTR